MDSSDVLTLLMIEGVGRRTILKLKNKLKNEDIDASDLNDLIEGIATIKKQSIKLGNASFQEAQRQTEMILEECFLKNITIISCFQRSFPNRLLEMGLDCPAVIFVKGDLSVLNGNLNIGIVGTRKPTDSGFLKGKQYSKKIVERRGNVVSGLALGCDRAGHLGALEGNGKTLAVIPNGIGHVYPNVHRPLYDKILESGGCILSEYAPNEPPQSYFFIERNRLQAALSDGLLIIESTIKGGTAWTYQYGLNYGKSIAVSQHEPYAGKYGTLNEQILVEDKGIPIKHESDLVKWMEALNRRRHETYNQSTHRTTSFDQYHQR